MTLIRLSTPILFFSSCLLFSCNKTNHGTPSPTVTGTMKINLANAPTTSGEEVIISESGGAILLDTMSPFNGSLVAPLKTNQTLVNFTIIDTPFNTQVDYRITTYMSVNPSLWATIDQGSYFAPSNLSVGSPGAVYYENIPNVSYNNFLFDDNYSYDPAEDLPITSQGSGYLGLNCLKTVNSSYLYLLFPDSRVYNIHLSQSLDDTVDLSHIDTAVTMNYAVPPPYTLTSTYLTGIMDTTNYNRSLLLYLYPLTPGLPEIEYPAKGVQKYELNVLADYGNNGSASYYSYANTIPSTLPFPAEPAFTLTSPLYSNFSVQFNGEKPLFYQSIWENTTIYWNLYSSPDSATITPQHLLTSLHSKMLQEQDLSTMTTHSFTYGSVSPEMAYADWWTYLFNPAQNSVKRINSILTFTQDF